MADDSLLSLLTDIVDNKPSQPPQQPQQQQVPPQAQRFQQQPPSIPATLQIPQQPPPQRRNALSSAPIQNPMPNVHTGNPAFHAAMQAATATMPNVTMPPVAAPVPQQQQPQQQPLAAQQEAQMAQWRKALPPEKFELMEKLVKQQRTNQISKEEFQRNMAQFVMDARAYKQQQQQQQVATPQVPSMQSTPAPAPASSAPLNAEVAKQVQAKALSSYVQSSMFYYSTNFTRIYSSGS